MLAFFLFKEPIAKVLSGNLLPHFGVFESYFQADYRGMEPPYHSIQPENPLKVRLHLIHPDFCNWL